MFDWGEVRMRSQNAIYKNNTLEQQENSCPLVTENTDKQAAVRYKVWYPDNDKQAWKPAYRN